ncbi:helix-turn-helix transcriptional regulator [Kitasatospora sp. Ki12]|uniref:ArsR/SmtB family transcription factor n=1 Tax=Kitasatospora xanthocidica TaxID=83382 RepID=UPI0019B5E33E|nr:helix-turn-helix domain-containing protein [Kitasatospora xanthocidica]GHF69299.1 transcriptional regulator [Kitasatospora xanthocidica]
MTAAHAAVDRIGDHPDAADITLQRILEAFADPVRRSIVRQIANAPDDTACGTFDISVTRSTGTHHFRVLRQSGLIRQYYVGTSKMNTLRRDDLEQAFPGLLDALIAAANREAAAARGAQDASQEP